MISYKTHTNTIKQHKNTQPHDATQNILNSKNSELYNSTANTAMNDQVNKPKKQFQTGLEYTIANATPIALKSPTKSTHEILSPPPATYFLLVNFISCATQLVAPAAAHQSPPAVPIDSPSPR